MFIGQFLRSLQRSHISGQQRRSEDMTTTAIHAGTEQRTHAEG